MRILRVLKSLNKFINYVKKADKKKAITVIIMFVVVIMAAIGLSLLINFPVTWFVNFVLDKIGIDFSPTYWQTYWIWFVINLLVGGGGSSKK